MLCVDQTNKQNIARGKPSSRAHVSEVKENMGPDEKCCAFSVFAWEKWTSPSAADTKTTSYDRVVINCCVNIWTAAGRTEFTEDSMNHLGNRQTVKQTQKQTLRKIKIKKQKSDIFGKVKQCMSATLGAVSFFDLLRNYRSPKTRRKEACPSWALLNVSTGLQFQKWALTETLSCLLGGVAAVRRFLRCLLTAGLAIP